MKTTKEQLLNLIDTHNSVVSALRDCDAKVDPRNMFAAMTVWHRLACEGYDIVVMARADGIDAVADMQSGAVIVHGNLVDKIETVDVKEVG